MKFRKKPVVIEAYQTIEPVIIGTLEGEMRASPGDWIITGVNGETYPCKPDIFEKTYDPVDSAPEVFYTAADLAKAREEGRREGGEIINKLRWVQDYDEYRDEPSYLICACCGEEKTSPEKHSADCYIGKWVALLDAKEAGE